MMVDPLSVVTAILTVAQLIRSAASTANQNKSKCLELAERAKNLADVLPTLAHAAANDAATARVLERLRDAVGEALRLVRSCQGGVGGMLSGSKRAAELDGVDKRINNCIMDLTLISQARAHTTNASKVTAAGSSSYYQAQGGGAPDAHVAWPPPQPTPQHAWSTPQGQGYYQAQGGGASVAHVAWPPSPPTPQHAWSTPQGRGYYQAQGGGASVAHVTWPPPTPTPQHAWSTPQGYYQQPPQGYYQQPPGGYVQWVPGPPPYTAYPAPSGSNLSSLYTLPTVNKIFNRLFR